ncbi:diacylglycerol/lipid kinase family protein [Solwaraspora sp. WMMB335]|uniref:diacylglycerol/lipid kinase family protein n=1 Tax=Solwaraspora sp. WMMB335 TaxID=3404118 RepID=UPI003B95B97B
MAQTDAVTRRGAAVRSAVVINPAKIADVDEFRALVGGVLAEAGWAEPLWLSTTVDDPGEGQARQAVASGVDVVFACGGDGTVMSCVAGLVGTDTALAILPAGTGNLLAANLGLSTDVAAGLQAAVDRGRRRIDVGQLDHRYFVVMAGMGFDAKMLAATSEKTKARIGWPAYLVGALRHLRDRPMRVRLRIDDGPVVHTRARTVLVANVGRLQGGITLLAGAEPDDGQLDVAVLTPRSLRHWLAMGWALIRGTGRVPRMQVYRGREVSVCSDRDQPRELDGDLIESGRTLRVSVCPAALWLCVPRPEADPDLSVDAKSAAERGEDLVERVHGGSIGPVPGTTGQRPQS